MFCIGDSASLARRFDAKGAASSATLTLPWNRRREPGPDSAKDSLVSLPTRRLLHSLRTCASQKAKLAAPRLSWQSQGIGRFLRVRARSRVRTAVNAGRGNHERMHRAKPRRGLSDVGARRALYPSGLVQTRQETTREMKSGSPSRTRTCDHSINSRMLYQLSYRGSAPGGI
jgi:hypothetical protein